MSKRTMNENSFKIFFEETMNTKVNSVEFNFVRLSDFEGLPIPKENDSILGVYSILLNSQEEVSKLTIEMSQKMEILQQRLLQNKLNSIVV